MGAILTCCCWIPTGIAAIVIAQQYNEDGSPCNNGTNYMVDLHTFLYVIGGVQLGSIGFNILLTIMCSSGPSSRSNEFDEGTMMVQLTSSLVALLMFPFLFVWSIIGVFMYRSQMSATCRTEPIAELIHAWSIITIVLFAVYILLFCMIFGSALGDNIRCCRCCFEDEFDRKYASYANMSALQRTETRYKSLLRKQRSVYKSITVREYEPAKDYDRDDVEKEEIGNGAVKELQTTSGGEENISGHEDEEEPEAEYLKTGAKYIQ